MDHKNNISFEGKLQYQILLVFLIAFHSYFGIYKGINNVKSDFPNYYVSAHLLQTGDLAVAYNDSLFQIEAQKKDSNIHARFSLYPPTNALLLFPLNTFSIYAAKNIWLAVSVACTFLSIFFFSRISLLNISSSAVIVLLSGFNLCNDFYLGQIYSFLLMLTLSGLYYMTRKPFLSAIFISLVASLKLITLGFSFLLVRKKYIPSAILFAIILTGITFLSAYMGGFQVFANYVSQRLIPLSFGNIFNELPFSVQYQSVISLLSNCFVYNAEYNPNPVFPDYNNLFLPCKFLFYGIMVCVLGLNLRWFISKKIDGPVFISLSILILLLLESGSATYHLLFLLPVLSMVLADVNFIASQKMTLIVLLAAIGFAPTMINSVFDLSYLPFILKYPRLLLMITYFCFVQYLYFQRNKKSIII